MFLPWLFPQSWQGLPESHSHSAHQFLSKRILLNYSSQSRWHLTNRDLTSCLLCPAYKEQWQCPVSAGGCSQRAKMLPNHPAQILRETLLFRATCRTPWGKTCPGGPCEKDLYQVGVPRMCSPQSFPSFIPGLKLSAQQLELQVKQHLFSNVRCSKGWCESTAVAAFKMLSTLSGCCQEALSWFPCPQLPFIPTCLPDTCIAALPLCRSTELPGTACSITRAPASKGYLHLPAGDTPQIKGNRAINQAQKTCWQPQAFRYFHRESDETGKNKVFFKSILGPLK